jgi:hypothetical protein
MSLVYIAGTSKGGKRCWFTGTDNRLNRLQQPIQVPLFDDENSRQVDLAFALDARERWRKDFGISVQITLEKYGPPIDEDRGIVAPEHDLRRPQFVKFSNGLGIIVTPGNMPNGQTWFVKALDIPVFKIDGRHTAIESVSGDSQIEAAQKAVDTYGQQILFADSEAIAEKERQQVIKNRNYIPGLRPADR